MFDLLDLIWKLLSQIIIGVRIIRWFGLMDELRYREFYHEIGNIEKCLFTYWLNGGDGFSKL